jgi:co-chaperonin GroES (HSP10)
MIETGFILATKLLIKPEEIKEQVSSGGLILPNTRKAPQISGTVLKTGTGTEQVPMVIKEGATVFFYERAAQPVQLFGQDLLLLDIREVLFHLG